MISHEARYEGGKIIVRSLTGDEVTLSCTPDQYTKGVEAYKRGALMQNAFPTLLPYEREFLISGYTKAAWDKLFSDVEEEE
jgi:hypothetical protein